MSWCGYWQPGFGAFWWALPLFGLFLMGVMLFVSLGGFACMGGRWCASGELSDLERALEGLKQDVRRPLPQPS